MPPHWLEAALREYGYAAVGLGVLLESMGLPLPGESLMIAAALYAATTHQLSIFLIVPIAAVGAVCGDQIGYFLGRWIGGRVLVRWGGRVGISQDRLDLGWYLFRRYGGIVVFAGRFVAFLRTFVALLAGANRMDWRRFALWNALGGIAWTSLYGFGAYGLGKAAKHLSGPVGIGLGVVGAGALVASFLFVKRHESQMLEEARREMQGASAATRHPAENSDETAPPRHEGQPGR